jgi:hypothetical protein
MSWLEDTFKVKDPIQLLINQTVIIFDENAYNFYIMQKK